MSREVRRVPLDFTWPLNEVWSGYLSPEKFHEDSCPDCERGYAPRAEYLFKLFYGRVPFNPAETGSTELTAYSGAVRAFAQRNVDRAPDFYGSGEAAIDREAWRLAHLWNRQWGHHLTQADVDALVTDGRLRDFTHRWTAGEGWQAIEPPVTPTADQVNEWSLTSMGHDSINAAVVVRARCEREGAPIICATCEGHGSLEAYEGQRAEAEAWEPTEPPTGEGWQLWETISEGSPVTPVFATREGLVDHLSSDAYPRRLTRDEAEGLVAAGWVPSGVSKNGVYLDGEKVEGEFAAIVLDLPERD